VAARSTADVVAGVNFVRQHNVRLVVKGGGHSYLGGSNAPDSLLIWTRAMNRIELHNAFVPLGSSTRYVQGGGCASVGVAGLVQGGGFGSFSKRYGSAAASLLQAEIVTADGVLRKVSFSWKRDGGEGPRSSMGPWPAIVMIAKIQGSASRGTTSWGE
jgi:FAD/FMN-containing dehydrogenase